jgi:peptidoglycan/LPS O-acetylase OafA/YrhL
MSKQKILALEYIRGISMLGVVGIHTGSYSLSNPTVNVHLFALLEILTRFSVPIFFFVSAFGLFLHQDLTGKLNYRQFMVRRARTVLLPYIVWSLFYMIHYTVVSKDLSLWHPSTFFEYLLFGLASCQLYFLVILLWFYALMPLWRSMVGYIIKHPLRNLGMLLLFQIIFNCYSSHLSAVHLSNYYLNKALSYRLNYWVLHYIFIFLLGAVCAVKYADFAPILKRYQQQIKIFFCITAASMLSYYYYLLNIAHYSPEEAVNTAQQLSTVGIFYTLGSTLFLFMLFNQYKMPTAIDNTLALLGKYSYLVYLVHPFIMYHLSAFLLHHNIIMSAKIVIAFYLCTTTLSLLFAMIVTGISKFFPIVNLLLTGSGLAKPKSGV